MLALFILYFQFTSNQDLEENIYYNWAGRAIAVSDLQLFQYSSIASSVIPNSPLKRLIAARFVVVGKFSAMFCALL